MVVAQGTESVVIKSTNQDEQTPFFPGKSSFLFARTVVLLSSALLLAPLQASFADNIFDLVTQSKNSSKSNSSTAKPGSSVQNVGTTGGASSLPLAPANVAYPSAVPAGAAYPASGATGTLAPAAGQAGAAYSPGVADATGYSPPPSNGVSNSPGMQGNPASLSGQSFSGLNNAVNRGIQNNLQRGLNRGAGALDRLGRKVGLQGLGTMLNSPGGLNNQSTGLMNSSSALINTPGGPTAVPYAQQYSQSSIPSFSGAGSSPSAEKAAFDAAGRRARQSEAEVYLRSAQQAEARGDWNQAAFAYRQATGNDDLTQEDSDAAARNHTSVVEEMLKRKMRDPSIRQLNMKWAYCAVQLLNQDYAGQKTNIDPRHTEHELYSAFLSLKDSDKGNAAWNYLCAVYWCSENRTKDWNYIKAWNQLLDALKCPRISPSLREKCLVLQTHIKPAKQLQCNDLKRAVFSMEEDLVWNVEHPHVAGTITHQSTSRIDDTHERITTWSEDYMNTDLWAVETYPDAKRDLKEKCPAFKAEWLKQLNEMMALPNQSVAIPPGPPNEEPALYCPPHWEQLAFGPLDLTIGRQYPHYAPGGGHSDPDFLPKAYISRMNGRLKGK